jgi:acetyltransferase-like isoleucine patch superfamily enzyme
MFHDDERPCILRRYLFLIRTWLHSHILLKKKFASIGTPPMVWGIWNIVVYGPNIHLGKRVLIVGADGFRTALTTLRWGEHEGSIEVGNDVLIMNGVRVSSASRIVIGDETMLANFCYLMDADWHDIYDRTSVPGKTRPIILGKNVWVGDHAIVCKGVTVGDNSIIGAGSVVRENVPPNVIVAGNPARVVRELDPDKIRLKSERRKAMDSIS